MLASTFLNRQQDLLQAENHYPRLFTLLQQERWQDADLETAKLLLKFADKEKECWLKVEDIHRVPGQVLRNIDALWLHWSEERFGFSVQKRIWKYADQNYTSFGDRVGWRQQGAWLGYHELTFSRDAALGHLPALNLVAPLAHGEHIFSFVLGRWRVALLARPDL